MDKNVDSLSFDNNGMPISECSPKLHAHNLCPINALDSFAHFSQYGTEFGRIEALRECARGAYRVRSELTLSPEAACDDNLSQRALSLREISLPNRPL